MAVAGLVFVLDVFGVAEIDMIGVLWGLIAAVGMAAYYVMSADETTGLPPLVLATGGLTVGTLILLLAGLVGVVPMTRTTAEWCSVETACRGGASSSSSAWWQPPSPTPRGSPPPGDSAPSLPRSSG